MMSYGTIYTTKLLRRGIDVDRAAPWRAFADMTAGQAMRSFPAPLPVAAGTAAHDGHDGHDGPGNAASAGIAALPGPVTHERDPQALFAGESLAQALRQLEVYGSDGLPVLSPDGQQVQGWVTNASVLRTIAAQLRAAEEEAPQAQLEAGWALPDPGSALPEPPTPLPGYKILEVTISDGSPAAGQTLGTITWPPGAIPVSVLRGRQLRDPDPGIVISAGDRINLLAASPSQPGEPPAPITKTGTDTA
jgi:CIC family chloride channel protein